MAEGLSTRFRVLPGRLEAFLECARSQRAQFDNWGASTLTQVIFSGGSNTGEYVLTQLFENGHVMAAAFDAAVLELGRPLDDLFAVPHDVATIVEREHLVEVQPFTFDPATIPSVFRVVEVRATPENAALLQATIRRASEVHLATGADAVWAWQLRYSGSTTAAIRYMQGFRSWTLAEEQRARQDDSGQAIGPVERAVISGAVELCGTAIHLSVDV